jgi:penicillin V acylase-like amidase (Ntn superfamily)
MFLVRLTIILLIFIGQCFAQGNSCSAFTVNHENILLAKNLDWDLGNGLIIFNPKGEIKQSVFNKDSQYNWTAKYSSITFNHFGLNHPLGGMNESGLCVEELSTWPAKYPSDKKTTLNEFEWIQFQLDNFSTVDECLANIENYAISKFFFNIHFILTDATGHTAVVEFINGKPVYYHKEHLPIPVLTNNNYQELVRYDSLHTQKKRRKLDVNFSQDRFIKIDELLETQTNDGIARTHLDAINILDSVKVSDTKWSIVYDVLNKNIYYTTSRIRKISTINFSNFNQLDEYHYFNINSENEPKFKKFSKSDNDLYLDNLIVDINEVYGSEGNELINRINNFLK